MADLFVCGICGEPYIGGEAPDDCPFCGAPKKFITGYDDFSTLWNGDLTEQEKEDLQETVDLEVNATAYYRDVSDSNEKYSKMNRLFKQFARVEEEHAEVACKLLGIEEPEMKGEKSKGSVEEDLKRTRELEREAVKKYKKFMERAENENVRKFFEALIHAEKGHHDHVDRELE